METWLTRERIGSDGLVITSDQELETIVMEVNCVQKGKSMNMVLVFREYGKPDNRILLQKNMSPTMKFRGLGNMRVNLAPLATSGASSSRSSSGNNQYYAS
jgi:hypothetical protein